MYLPVTINMSNYLSLEDFYVKTGAILLLDKLFAEFNIIVKAIHSLLRSESNIIVSSY